MSDTLQEEFWDAMEDIRAAMLSSENARAVPMSHHVDPDLKALWFITANGTDLAKDAQNSVTAQYVVSSKGEGFHARIDGKLTAVTDAAKLDEMWNVFVSAWFEDGKRDPDIQLLRMDLTEAEIWESDGSLSFLYEIAKANLTDTKPDAGKHGTIRF